jgi:hypothetical protein
MKHLKFLPKEIHTKIKRRIASRILSTNKEKWWTVSAFYSECDEIRENDDKIFSFKTVDEKLKFLDGINDYVMNLEQKIFRCLVNKFKKRLFLIIEYSFESIISNICL